ncbi:hypothetical protein [Granulicella aggregans]|jgi:hypothetical protein|uniref:hypothetical protein n=1 Tax=Granulicella aggregans TaxID=474949 RepID=UPI0021E05F4B|nr:hypothetical protein [Granulicella aggregans]
MKVMELPGWPPEATGTFDPLRGATFAGTADTVYIERVIRATSDVLMFACSFNDGKTAQHPVYHWNHLGDNALKVEKILHNNIGELLLSIGTIGIPEDD